MKREDLWIEYLEKEADPLVADELEKILFKNRRERSYFDELAQLKQWTKQSDPVGDLWRESSMVRLSQKILGALDSVEMTCGGLADAQDTRRPSPTMDENLFD